MHQFARLVVGVALTACIALGCSWGYGLWPKSKTSDTPLFRFTVKERNGTGYIDRKGKVVIRPIFDSSSFGYPEDDFHDGLAKVSIGEEDWYIDVTGKRKFRAESYGGVFSEGLATNSSNAKVGFINTQGKLVIPRSFDTAEAFSEGLAVVSVNGLYGYINRDGSGAIKPKYVMAMPFSDGAARVIEQGPCSYNSHGPCSFEPYVLPHKPGDDFSNRTSLRPCRYSFVDRNGMRLFERQFTVARDFTEGLAPVNDGNRWGYVDKKGMLVIPLRYENAGPFSEGLAAIKIGGKWGYIDKTGALVMSPRFLSASEFSEGFAIVSDREAYAYFINKTGQRAFAGDFTMATSFAMGLAHVRVGEDYYSAKWSYLDHIGRAVFTYSDQSKKR